MALGILATLVLDEARRYAPALPGTALAACHRGEANLPRGQNWQLVFYLCGDGNGDPNRREYQTVGTLPCAVTNWGEVAAWCLLLVQRV